MGVDALGGAAVGGQSKVQFRCNRAEVGIMVDARGRPVELSADPLQRAAQNAKWRTQIGALGQSGVMTLARRALDSSWL